MPPCIIADTVQSVALEGRLKIYHQKKTNISESTAPFSLKLLVRLVHMYTKVWKFWDPAVYGPHGIRGHTTTSSP